MTIVRMNIMSQENYTPYCGNDKCKRMPRTHFNGKQFACSCCKWESSFESEFIESYKRKWGK